MEQDLSSLAEALAKAHAALLKDLRELDEVSRLPSCGSPKQMATRLAATQEHITEHFRFEEKNGYLDVVRKREPQMERTIEELQDEHWQLLLSLKVLLSSPQKVFDMENLAPNHDGGLIFSGFWPYWANYQVPNTHDRSNKRPDCQFSRRIRLFSGQRRFGYFPVTFEGKTDTRYVFRRFPLVNQKPFADLLRGGAGNGGHGRLFSGQDSRLGSPGAPP